MYTNLGCLTIGLITFSAPQLCQTQHPCSLIQHWFKSFYSAKNKSEIQEKTEKHFGIASFKSSPTSLAPHLETYFTRLWLAEQTFHSPSMSSCL